MDLGNSVMRQSCLHSSMAALKEVARVFPMVALNRGATRLAVGDLIGDVRKLTIEIYDLQKYVTVMSNLSFDFCIGVMIGNDECINLVKQYLF